MQKSTWWFMYKNGKEKGFATVSRSVAQGSQDAIVPDAQIARFGLREKVTEQLLAAVFERRLASGERLVVQKLSTMFGVSPTPVRESLVELDGLGIVELIPNHGAVIKPFGPTELRDMCQVRRVLEAEAARCAYGCIPLPGLRQLHSQLENLSNQDPSDARDRSARGADTLLHEMIAAHCGNHRLAAEIRKYLSLFRALRNVSHLRDSWNN